MFCSDIIGTESVILFLVTGSDGGVRPCTGGKFTIYQPIKLYRKFKADNIFDGHQFHQQQVLITDADGIVQELVDEKDAGEGVEVQNGIICPGFINAHCHLELSHMKGLIPKQTGLVDFVLKVVKERHPIAIGFEESEILNAIEQAEDEMLQNGIVAVGDICNNALTIPQKTKQRLQYHNFIEASGFPPTVAAQRFARAESFYNEYLTNNLQASIVPHAPYSVSPEMFALINDFPGNNLLTIHNQETVAETELFEKGTGDFLRMYAAMGIDISFFKATKKSSLQTWLPNFTKEQTIIMVHNVCTTQEDILFEKRTTNNEQSASFYCLCPNANLYISNTLPDVKMLMEQDCNIVLGTDSLASNDQLSILEEIKTLQNNFPEIGLDVLLKWATSNGSKALQMDSVYGDFDSSLLVRKKPGVVLIEGTDGLRLTKNASSKRLL